MVENFCAVIVGLIIALSLVVCFYFSYKYQESRDKIRLENLERFFSFLLEWKAGVVPVEQLQELFDKFDEVMKK